MVMVWLHRGEELFLRRGENGRWKIAIGNRRSLAALAIVAAEGFDFPYFSVFAGVFLAVARATAFALHRQWIVLARTAILLAVLGAAVLTSLSPNLRYYFLNGTNKSDTHASPVGGRRRIRPQTDPVVAAGAESPDPGAGEDPREVLRGDKTAERSRFDGDGLGGIARIPRDLGLRSFLFAEPNRPGPALPFAGRPARR